MRMCRDKFRLCMKTRPQYRHAALSLEPSPAGATVASELVVEGDMGATAGKLADFSTPALSWLREMTLEVEAHEALPVSETNSRRNSCVWRLRRPPRGVGEGTPNSVTCKWRWPLLKCSLKKETARIKSQFERNQAYQDQNPCSALFNEWKRRKKVQRLLL
jgi:hypothetical protein